MKLRNPWLIRLAGLLGAWLIRWWMWTIRCRYYWSDHRTDPHHPKAEGRYLYVFWHETMLVLAEQKANTQTHVLISQHADGELIAQVCRYLGLKVVRGSSTRGGIEAVRQLLRFSQRSHLAVTPDGPRGPRRRVQPGVIYLASRTGLPIVPVSVGYRRAWRLNSWDRFAIPKPWSTVTCVATPPIWVPPDLNKQQLEHYRRLVEQELTKATALAEEWAASGERGRQPPDKEKLKKMHSEA